MALAPRLLRPRQVGGFDPRTIANLVWWLDASDISTMSQNSNGTGAVAANGDPVGRLANKASASSNATQTTNNLRPTLLTSGINTRPSLSVSSTLGCGFNVSPPSAASANTYFFVGRNTQAATSGWLTLANETAGGSFLDATQSGSASAANGSSGSPTYRVNRTSIGATRGDLFTATNGRDYLLTVENFNMSSGWATMVLMRYDSAFDFIGTFAEVLLYSRALSASEVAVVENALSAKWGIA